MSKDKAVGVATLVGAAIAAGMGEQLVEAKPVEEAKAKKEPTPGQLAKQKYVEVAAQGAQEVVLEGRKYYAVETNKQASDGDEAYALHGTQFAFSLRKKGDIMQMFRPNGNKCKNYRFREAEGKLEVIAGRLPKPKVETPQPEAVTV